MRLSPKVLPAVRQPSPLPPLFRGTEPGAATEDKTALDMKKALAEAFPADILSGEVDRQTPYSKTIAGNLWKQVEKTVFNASYHRRLTAFGVAKDAHWTQAYEAREALAQVFPNLSSDEQAQVRQAVEQARAVNRSYGEVFYTVMPDLLEADLLHTLFAGHQFSDNYLTRQATTLEAYWPGAGPDFQQQVARAYQTVDRMRTAGPIARCHNTFGPVQKGRWTIRPNVLIASKHTEDRFPQHYGKTIVQLLQDHAPGVFAELTSGNL